jgi:hypothetical protein
VSFRISLLIGIKAKKKKTYLGRTDARIVDLLLARKVNDSGSESVHLGRLKDDSRGRGVGELGGLSDERVESVNGVIVAEPVDTKV